MKMIKYAGESTGNARKVLLEKTHQEMRQSKQQTTNKIISQWYESCTKVGRKNSVIMKTQQEE